MSKCAAALERLEQDFKIVRVTPTSSHCASQGSQRSVDKVSSKGSSQLLSRRATREEAEIQPFTSRSEPTTAFLEVQIGAGQDSSLEAFAPEHQVKKCMDELGTLREELTALRTTVSAVVCKQSSPPNDCRFTSVGQSTLTSFRSALHLRPAQQKDAVLTELQEQAEQNRSQITDLRHELDLLREQQEVLLATILSDAGRLHAANRDELQEQAAMDLTQGIPELSLRVPIADNSFNAELKHEVKRLREEFELERSRAREQAVGVGNLTGIVKEHQILLDHLGRKIGEAHDNHLSEITVLRGRFQACVGLCQQTVSHTDTLQRLFNEEKSRLSVQVAQMLSRLESLESKVTCNTHHRILDGPNADVTSLWKALRATESKVSELREDLSIEQRERQTSFVDAGRFAEEVAKAAAATTGRAEQRFADDFASDYKGSSRAVDGAAIFSDVARLVGEMEAELCVELTSRLKLLVAEIRGEILSDIAARVASKESRVRVMNESQDAEFHRVIGETQTRLGKLEAAKLDMRQATLEGEVQRVSLALASLEEERRRRTSMGVAGALQTNISCASASSRRESSVGEPQRGQSSDVAYGPQRRQASGSLDPQSGVPLPDTLKESLKDIIVAVNRTLNRTNPASERSLSSSPHSRRNVVNAQKHQDTPKSEVPHCIVSSTGSIAAPPTTSAAWPVSIMNTPPVMTPVAPCRPQAKVQQVFHHPQRRGIEGLPAMASSRFSSMPGSAGRSPSAGRKPAPAIIFSQASRPHLYKL